MDVLEEEVEHEFFFGLHPRGRDGGGEGVVPLPPPEPESKATGTGREDGQAGGGAPGEQPSLF